jgi:hypothetical protein
VESAEMAARLDELTRFVRDCLSRQIPRGEVEAALLGAGWHPQQVRRALDTYADSPFPVPVPRPVAYVSAGEAFLYLVLFSALGISAGSLVQLLFTLIEWAFYDPSSSTFVYDGWQYGCAGQSLGWSSLSRYSCSPPPGRAGHSGPTRRKPPRRCAGG